ncbi:M48 family metalloprotease [Microvirga sp. SRT01]|uniref:M48 family metalloprotease n=1 Tax=Sphingomonas longa TaxID=2778730 RepID=A0ABS2D7A8_9SPHN|nr:MULTISPECIES: M48 family metalloprotease [Alphaproteobacteria]MBM6576805.1 M48 family metalloprotease [Sphingomonas sp. BT552]MBR7709850.1 M48 family metalloprotease [Microvirga sp. SRT01]
MIRPTHCALLLAGIAAPLAGPLAAPVTAQQTRAISASDKQQGAQANPQLVAEYGGAYRGPQAAYVERIGRRVAVQSGLSNATGDFTITTLNSPVENAFANPGGYVYVTRQLLALMNSEAELASVLGHEVGHVAARHSASRNTRSKIGSIGAAILGAVTGSSAVGQLAGTGAQLYTLGYGRSQEYQADGLGVRYITAAGYDPYAAAAMLTQLDAETTLTARIAGRDAKGTPSWASTHPNGADRIARARKLAQDTGRPPATGAQDTAFLRMLDGLPYDDDPAQGVVDGQTFRHPELRVRFSAPTGYTIANGTDAVTIAGSGGQAMFQGSQSSSPDAAITARFRALGADVGESESQSGTANGLSYTYRTIRAAANNRAVDATVVAYRFPSAIYTFTLVTPAGAGIGPFQPLLASVAALTPTQAAAIKGKIVRVVAVKAGDTIESLSARMAYPDYRRERFLTLNGLSANDRLQPGRLVKLVVTG